MSTTTESRPACHVLVIALDEEAVGVATKDGVAIDPLDQEYQRIVIRCEANENDFTRPCITWIECACELTEEQHDELSRDGEGPCPESPTGLHRDYIGDLSPARPTSGCWAILCDDSADAAHDLADKHHLGPGEYRIAVYPSPEYIEFELIKDGAA